VVVGGAVKGESQASTPSTKAAAILLRYAIEGKTRAQGKQFDILKSQAAAFRVPDAMTLAAASVLGLLA